MLSSKNISPENSETKTANSNTTHSINQSLIENAKKLLTLSIEEIRKINIDSIEKSIQSLIEINHSRQEIYSVLQKIFADELNNCMNSALLFLIGEKYDRNRRETIDRLLKKHFGFAGYITAALFIQLDIGSALDQFEALKTLCLSKLVFEKFPKHESIQIMNNFFKMDSSMLFEFKDGKLYFSNEPIDEFLKDLSEKIGNTKFFELNDAAPSKKLEAAYEKANKIFKELKFTETVTQESKKENDQKQSSATTTQVTSTVADKSEVATTEQKARPGKR